jgi:hypothetical protein
MKLNIEIDGSIIRVFVGGSQIGLMKNIALTTDEQGLPVVMIEFPPEDLPGMSEGVKKAIASYKDQLSQVPCVKLVKK